MSSQYRSILKATSIFGGTQILQLLVQLIRTKFVAMLVGATGMGLSSIYMSSLTVVITFFGMGINTSVVRDLSKANDEGDDLRFSLIINVFKRMLFILSCLGSLFVLCTSSLLSSWSFGSFEHTEDYGFLSIIIFFTLLSQGNSAILIGRRRVRDIALSTLYGSIVTLLTSVPFFYFWRLDGIVPGIIVSTIASYIISFIYARKVKLPQIKISWSDVRKYGYSILSLGFTMVIASLVGNLTVYLINICITHLGGIEDLGFFNAGMAITQNVVSLVFAAMGADYYPRLVASLKSKELMCETINEQSEILICLSVPILAIFSLMSPLIIRILLSGEFLVLNSFVRILCVGMFVKVVSYALGYVSFAKGDKMIYVFIEGGYSNLSNLVISVSFYYLWGLQGIAYSFVIHYLLYYFIIRLVDRCRYNYKCSYQNAKVTYIGGFSILFIYALSIFLSDALFYVLASTFTLVISLYYLKELNRKTELLSFIKMKIFKVS